MKKYIIASFLMIFSMSFKQQQQDSTKVKENAKIKEDSIRKADLAEIKRRLRNTPPVKTSSQRDFSEQFKPDPSKKVKSDYIYDKGRVVGGSSTLKIGKN
jgi:hypothetical protein